MSIAASVLDAVRAESLLHGGVRVTRAGLRIGELSGVSLDSLRFCLEALVAGTDLAPLPFDFDPVPWTRRCTACDTTFRVVNSQPACPACASPNTLPADGDQLELSFIELEEP